jgi:asparagine synthase (glutamine-hydrolysing)
MCGIIGAVSVDGTSIDASAISRLTPLLHHRGPDQSGVRTIGPACFGHTRLSIIGPSNEAASQPCSNQRYLLSFNGEIYNYQDLARSLGRHDQTVSGKSDTEVLFHCLQLWPIDKTLRMLDGMFAFAFFDRLENKLFLARDPLGEKPLYWARTKTAIFFASQTRALLNAEEISNTPNHSLIDDYFYTGTINGSQTFFRDIEEVEPGTVICINMGSGKSPKKERYWSVTECLTSGESHNQGSIYPQLSTRIENAVASRMVSDVPIGLLLSGGIDSATLAEFLLSAEPTRELHFFFTDNPASVASEKSNMTATLGVLRARYPQADLVLHEHVFDPSTYINDALRLSLNYDQPITFPISPQLANLTESASAQGFKVLLSGEGADELFFGYQRFIRAQLSHERSPDDEMLCKRLLYFGGGWDKADRVPQLTGKSADNFKRFTPWAWLEKHYGTRSFAALQMLFSQRFRLQTLLQRQDRVGMLNGVEIRVPFLQPSFVHWINSLPDQTRMPKPTEDKKILLRNLMKGKLAATVLSSEKMGSPSEIVNWLYTDTGVRMTQDLSSDSKSFTMNFLDKAYVRSMLKAVATGDRSFSTLLWHLFSLELWFASINSSVESFSDFSTLSGHNETHR